MYKVLIVDDEPFILEGLKYIINWEEHGLEIVSAAENGVEALEALERMKIDIIITDIKMPKMDGLNLIRNIKLKGINTKIVILSGYTEFEYAREAVKLGIENYILKPIQEDELSSTLLATVDKIEAELYTKIEYEKGLEIMRENILYRWVTGTIGDTELKQRSDIIGITLDSDMYLAAIIGVLYSREAIEPSGLHPDANTSLSISDIEQLRFFACNIFRKRILTSNKNSVFINLSGDIVIIFSWNEEEKFYFENTLELLKTCIEDIHDSLKTNIYAYIGSIERSYFSIAKSYANALWMRNNQTDFPSHRLIQWNAELMNLQTQNNADYISRNFSPLIKKAIEYVQNRYNEEISLKTMSNIFNVHPAYLGQQFKKETQQLFTNYLNNVRIEKAKEMLLNNEFKANEIGKKVGYSNQNYFYNIFKKFTGVYPTEFKMAKTQH